MDRTGPLTAADVVNTYPAARLAQVLREYGEERFARRIADAVVRERARTPLTSTMRLSEIVRDSIPAPARRTGGNPAKRTFQALRIEVNGELEALRRALPAALDALAVGGRIVVLAYHSLEDRMVKQRARGQRGGHHPARPAGAAGRGPAAVPAADPGRGAARRGGGGGQPARRVGPAAGGRAGAGGGVSSGIGATSGGSRPRRRERTEPDEHHASEPAPSSATPARPPPRRRSPGAAARAGPCRGRAGRAAAARRPGPAHRAEGQNPAREPKARTAAAPGRRRTTAARRPDHGGPAARTTAPAAARTAAGPPRPAPAPGAPPRPPAGPPHAPRSSCSCAGCSAAASSASW